MMMNKMSEAAMKVAELHVGLCRRAGASPFGSCPVDLTAAFVRMCLAQSCGKCVPCRVGLDRLQRLLEQIAAGEATAAELQLVKTTAQAIYDSADCAIGFEAAKLVLDGLAAFGDDYASHVERGVCTANFAGIPCTKGCPAHVDVPGYIACIAAGRYADAVRVIRKDNPFPGVCGYICEHPCEAYCRRNMVDAAINICGLKRYAVEKAGDVPVPECAPKNGKRVGVVGGGPAGLTAAYYLALKGFEVTVFERREKLGGMLRYGIPSYRLPCAELDREIEAILSTGMTAKLGVEIGRDIAFDELRKQFDAVYISIGAHGGKRLGIEGEDAEGVFSAVELLRNIGGRGRSDFVGRRVVVIGGGNVAMDATRTVRRLGAKSVKCIYRRRIVDMTAMSNEVADAQAEGCEIVQLMAPVRIATGDGKVTGLVVQPQVAGSIREGRPAPVKAALPEMTIPCDIVIVAIGQDVESAHFAKCGVDVKRGAIMASADGEVLSGGEKLAHVFTGGDCYTGPATVISAIGAGRVASVNIERSFGFDVPIESGVEIPAASAFSRLNWGRADMRKRAAAERMSDFEIVEKCLSDEEAKLECSRCLRCDHYGYGVFKGGRVAKW